MNLLVAIYKEKKKKDFRLVILPSGKNKIGLGQYKDYGIISYLSKKDSEKIGELIYWALNESDNEKIENEVNIEWQKKYFNRSSNLKVVNEYNNIGFQFFENKYKVYLKMKEGRGYSLFKDKNGNTVEHIFEEKPTALELGTKVMEMFEFKEKYDGIIEWWKIQRKTVNFYTEGPKAIYVNDETPGGKVLYENNFSGINALMQIGNTVKNARGTIPLIGYNGSTPSNSLVNGQLQASNFHSPKYPVVTYNPNAVALSTVNYFNPILNNHDSGLGNITYNSVPFVKGNIGGKIVSANSYVLKVPSGLQNDINQVVNGRDDGGFISERILVTTLNKDPNWEVFDGKYRYNNGFDVVARNKMTGEVWILESKQIENAVRLPVGAINGLSDNGAGGYRQLSQDWINEIVNNKLDRNNIARQIVEKAIKENNLNTGITGINRKTGELIIMPVKVQNK